MMSLSSARMIPYPVTARVRVHERWGSIALIVKNAGGTPLENPQYRVGYDDGGIELVEHADIAECYNGGMPYCIVLVDSEVFSNFAAECNMVSFQSASTKRDGKIPPARCNVIFWRSEYWITTGGMWSEYEDTTLKIENVTPRAASQGEIRQPHFTHRTNSGYIVITPDSKEYVCTGIVAYLAPLPQVQDSSRIEINHDAGKTQLKLFE